MIFGITDRFSEGENIGKPGKSPVYGQFRGQKSLLFFAGIFCGQNLCCFCGNILWSKSLLLFAGYFVVKIFVYFANGAG